MAQFDFEFPSEFQKQLEKLSNIDEIAPKMINEALPSYQKAIKATLSVHNRTGDLQRSVSIRKAKKAKNGGYIGNVYFRGYDSKGSPNNVKAAGLEYGNSRETAKPFLQSATNSCENEVINTMQEIYTKEVSD